MTEQHLTIKEAAEAMGISEKTVRRRIKDGTIKAEQTQGKYGVEYRITSLEDAAISHKNLDIDQVQGVVQYTDMENGQGTEKELEIVGDMSKALDIIKALQEENAKLTGQVGFLQAQIIELDRKVRLLADPKKRRSWRQRLFWWRAKPET